MDFETVGLVTLFLTAASAAASWLLRGGRPHSGRIAEEEVRSDPYRSSASAGIVRNEFPSTNPNVNFAFKIPRTHSGMDFENVTLSPRVRLDTKLDFHKIRNAWWVSRREHGRCVVQLQTLRNDDYEVMKPKVLYPVRFDELLKVNDEFFSLTIEPAGAAASDPLLNTNVSALNREILKGNWEAIRLAGACMGMIERFSMRDADLERVGVPSAVFVYLHRTTGRIIALVHNGRHPRPYEGVPQEIRNSTLPARLDLMANELARENDRRHIARYQVQGGCPEAMRPFLDALTGQMFQPIQEVMDARRTGNLP